MWAGVVLLSLIVATRSITAVSPNEAAVTQIINDVRFQSAQEAPHSAAINDQVPEGSSVETGMNSRTELTFGDQALVRLSANTRFSFNKGGRNLDLADGAVLLRVPKGAGEAKISMSTVTAAISGTTVIAEYHPHAYLKFISLEGIARLYLKSRWGESVLVRPGQMLITNPDGKRLPDPVIVDLARLMKTSLLFANFPPLPSQNLIAKESDKQQRAKSKRSLIDTNLVIFGKGTVVSLTNPAQMSAASQTAAVAARPASDAIPSSNDLGTIEMPPKPVVSQSASPTTNRSADVQR
jgi:hypothetical protein